MKNIIQFITLCVAVICTLVGCSSLIGGLANAPTQHVMVSTTTQTPADGVFVLATVFPPQGGYRSAIIQDEGGVLLLQRARPITSPGIGANQEIYLAAWWCARPGFNTLCLAVSEDGEQWDLPGSFLIASSSQINAESGPSVSYFPPTNTWFIAFRDASTSNILLTEFNIVCATSGGRCSSDSRGVTQFVASLVAGPTVVTTVTAGSTATSMPTTNFRPSISHVAGSLVLAYNASGTSPMRATFASSATPGVMPFTSFVTSMVSDGGAPYINRSVVDMMSAVGKINSSGGVDIDVFATNDGVTLTSVRTVPSVGSALPGLISPAISGTNDNLVAFRRNGQLGTTVDINGNQVHISTNTNRPVSLAHGPGPHATTTHSCNEPFLIVRGSGTQQLELSANDNDSISTNGDATLICGSFQATAGCPDNTNRVRVFRTLPGVVVECWN